MSVQRDIDAELRFHLEARIEELVAAGSVARSRARAGARRIRQRRARSALDCVRSTAVSRAAATATRVRGLLLQDMRYAARVAAPLARGVHHHHLDTRAGHRRERGDVLAARRDLPAPAGRRCTAGRVAPCMDRAPIRVGYAVLAGLRLHELRGDRAHCRRAGADDHVPGHPSKLRIGRGENAPTVRVVGATSNYFAILGVRLARGRFFTPQESAPGASAQVAVISDAFWARALQPRPTTSSARRSR